MRVVIVHNPSAGDETHGPGHLVQLIEEAGHAPEYFSSKDRGWERAVETADLVAVAGGDGTVAEVAKRLSGSTVPLAVLPLGTANNIARALGSTGLDLSELVTGWPFASPRRFDLGIVRGPLGMRPFLESVGAGLLAEGMAAIAEGRASEVDGHPTAVDRVTAAREVFARTLARMTPFRCRLSLDGVDCSGDYLLIELMNFGAAGPSLRLSDGSPSDGLLDVVLVDESHREALAAHFAAAAGAEPPALPPLPVRRAKRAGLAIDASRLHVDDEVLQPPKPGEPATRAFDVSMHEGALTMLAHPRTDRTAPPASGADPPGGGGNSDGRPRRAA